MRFIAKKISQKWIGVTYFKEQFLLFGYGQSLHNFTNMFWAQFEPSREQANHSFLDIETRLKIKNLLGDGGQSFCRKVVIHKKILLAQLQLRRQLCRSGESLYGLKCPTDAWILVNPRWVRGPCPHLAIGQLLLYATDENRFSVCDIL